MNRLSGSPVIPTGNTTPVSSLMQIIKEIKKESGHPPDCPFPYFPPLALMANIPLLVSMQAA
jgi:hypothetical protein